MNKQRLTKTQVMQALNQVIDPELGISITEMGLIYDVKIVKTQVMIVMTLTSMGCPLFPLIRQEIEAKLCTIGATQVVIDLVFDPPWNIDKMSESAKIQLGLDL